MAERERSNEKEASVLHPHFAHHTVPYGRVNAKIMLNYTSLPK